MPVDHPPPLGLRLLLADRYRVDARLLAPGARVDAVDTHATGGRRVRVACLELAETGDSAELRLTAWQALHGAGLPVCRGLAALDGEPGPLVVLEPPPPGGLRGDPAAVAAQARLLAGALAERGLRAGQIPALDLALDDDGTLVLAAPPVAAPVIDPRAEAERLAATVMAAMPAAGVDDGGPGEGRLPPPRGAAALWRWRPGRPGVFRGAALAVAAAAVLVLVGGSLRDVGPATPEAAPAAAPPARAPEPTAPLEVALDPLPLPGPRETEASHARPAARRPPPATSPPTRPARIVRPPAPPPAARPTPAPPPPRAAPRVRPSPAGRGWALGPDSPLGPPAAPGAEPR